MHLTTKEGNTTNMEICINGGMTKLLKSLKIGQIALYECIHITILWNLISNVLSILGQTVWKLQN